ncbi:anaerobic ribonucleoside-triphosphate reductase activating protein [Neisseria shayeganii 871]|uniref:Anaerobic ribonucleoside-triphosphate reductase activating protein n=1 Tax=Neisseria shayeganii 871 TaxID=1032488 RepID=G4CK90_9NEIS|nr:anaerobic ribonucleoside-triphosphate reductase activating protein [Neisseria shayeganii 871]
MFYWVSDNSFPQGFPLFTFLALSGCEVHNCQGCHGFLLFLVPKNIIENIFLFLNH